jgi:hypothetical protein
MFLQQLAQHAKSPGLQARICAFAVALSTAESANVEFGLQGWPPACAMQEPADRKILIGISSSHATQWTCNTRPAPIQPRADAWIYVPRQMVLVFECKNDSHPLDATQVSAYLWGLGLVGEHDGVPRPQPGLHLDPTQAAEVQAKYKDRVLDVPWFAVADALDKIQKGERAGDIGCWLSGQAAAYIRSHVRPPYQGVRTILEWLSGPDTPDRYDHLRTLVRKMGDALAAAAKGPGAITFTRDASGNWEVLPGVSSAVYVRLCKGRDPVEHRWLGKPARLNLWTCFSEHDNNRLGLDFWVEAPGAQLNLVAEDKESAWNQASDRHAHWAKEFEDAVAAWVRNAPRGCLVDANAIRFKGKSVIWKGGGQLAPDGPRLSLATPQEALTFLQSNREALWRFPRVGSGGDLRRIDEAQPLVRKPALALRPPLDVRALVDCGDNARELQAVFRKAVAEATAHGESDSGKTRCQFIVRARKMN